MADTPEVRDLIAQEFAGYDPASIAGPSRRRFLKLMAASMAMAGLTLTGCRRWPQEKLAPYTSNPEGRIPGAPEQYATAWEVAGVAQGLLVTSYDGRPIKIEGNPSHPFSVTIKDKQGAADAFAQASILEMYDPERSREVIDRTGVGREGARKGEPSDWTKFAAAAKSEFAKFKGNGQGLVILSEATNSPSVLAMKDRLKVVYPEVKWVEYEPLTWDAELEGSIAAFGKPLRTRLHLDKAKVVVSLDADLLGSHPAHLRYAADWAEMRRGGDNGEMNRVFMAESSFSITGTIADWRLPVDPSRIGVIARAIALNIGVQGINGTILNDSERRFADAAAAELKAAGGSGVIAVGASAPAAVHALAHVINQQIGAIGKTVTFIEDPSADRLRIRPENAGKLPTHMAAIADLAKDMAAGKVSTLVILGGNPAYDAPIDTDFSAALDKVPMTIRLGLYDDETSKLCKWHLPRAHYLESWGDARAWDGTATIVQPLIEPLFGGKSVIELLAMLAGDKETAGDQIVRGIWKEKFIKGGDFELGFRKALSAGVLPNSASPAVSATVTLKDIPAAPSVSPPLGTFFLKFEPDSHTYDGRYANNGWLQETHDPVTKLVWDNAALISVKDAGKLGIKTGDVIQLDCNDRWMKVAAYVCPGQPIGVIGLSTSSLSPPFTTSSTKPA
jgi:MoCo/4Fe-4S cofactor protein with predicted Tat translocation signal